MNANEFSLPFMTRCYCKMISWWAAASVLDVLVMFSEPYRNVKHFGIWAEESAGRFGQRDSLRVLRAACERCIDEDMRQADTFAALDYLTGNVTRLMPFVRFRDALDVLDPEERCRQLNAAFQAISRVLSP